MLVRILYNAEGFFIIDENQIDHFSSIIFWDVELLICSTSRGWMTLSITSNQKPIGRVIIIKRDCNFIQIKAVNYGYLVLYMLGKNKYWPGL